MNLRSVHAMLILLSALLAVVFGIWCLGQYGRGGGAANLVAAVAAFAVSAGLVVYDSWFLKKDKDVAMKRAEQQAAFDKASRRWLP